MYASHHEYVKKYSSLKVTAPDMVAMLCRQVQVYHV